MAQSPRFVEDAPSPTLRARVDSLRIARLTDRQRMCLRLVQAHLSSKEIALRVGIEPGTVDQHIKAAMLILGVSERRAAARILIEYEDCERRVQHSPRIALDTDPTKPAPSPEDEWPLDRDASSEAIFEDHADYDAFPAPRGPAPPPPFGRAGPDTMGWLRRLLWIVVIMIGMALAVGVLISALEALTRVVRD